MKKLTLITFVLFTLLTLMTSCSSDDGNEAMDKAFITTWETTTANETITIPTNTDEFAYNYTVDWGDGSTSANRAGDVTHTYATAGPHTIAISGTFPAIYFNDEGDKDKIQTITQWGDIEWQSMESAFHGCTNVTGTAIDAPNLSNVRDMSEMFERSDYFNQDLSNWDVSNVEDMSKMFFLSNFDGDISNWDVSNVEDMREMFSSNHRFSGVVSDWDVSSVTDMHRMFANASSFNQDLSNWNTNNVTSCMDFNDEDSALIPAHLPTLGPCF